MDTATNMPLSSNEIPATGRPRRNISLKTDTSTRKPAAYRWKTRKCREPTVYDTSAASMSHTVIVVAQPAPATPMAGIPHSPNTSP
jgi:hypothetical protein